MLPKYKMIVGVILASLIAGGCQQQNTVLSQANYKQKFDQVESDYHAKPGELKLGDCEAVLGLGESITAGHTDLVNAPPGIMNANLKWSRWEYQNEVLLVGFADNRAATMVRLRR